MKNKKRLIRLVYDYLNYDLMLNLEWQNPFLRDSEYRKLLKKDAKNIVELVVRNYKKNEKIKTNKNK